MQNNSGSSAIVEASRNGHVNVVELLSRNGAQVDLQKSNGWSALMIASVKSELVNNITCTTFSAGHMENMRVSLKVERERERLCDCTYVYVVHGIRDPADWMLCYDS